MKRRGFTLIETLVVLSVLTMMTSMLVLYNRTGERQILLLREKARLINTILRAKSLALNTFIEDEPACGYGVYINPATRSSPPRYFIYRDTALDCRYSDYAYSPTTDTALIDTTISLDAALVFQQLDVTDILFVPPTPQVFLNGGQSIPEAIIVLNIANGTSQVSITINNAGQISAE